LMYELAELGGVAQARADGVEGADVDALRRRGQARAGEAGARGLAWWWPRPRLWWGAVGWLVAYIVVPLVGT